jgi:hypothetical protein
MRESRFVLVAAVAFLLGCGSAATHADDKKPDEKKDEKKGDEKPDEKAPAEKKPAEKPKKRYTATVTDRFGTEPFKIDGAEVSVPQVSLLGGESFQYELRFVVKHGAAEIEVPFEEISKVTFGDVKEDRLGVTVEFKAADKADKQLTGTVKSNLQLHGKYQQRQLEAKLKLREIKTLVLEEAK